MLFKYLKKISIKLQIAFIFFFISVISFSLGFIILYFGFSNSINSEITEIGSRTINSLEKNLNIIFDNVRLSSNMIFFDNDIQSALKNNKTKEVLPENLQVVKNTVSSLLLSADYISAVILIDSNGTYYKSYKSGPISVFPAELEQKSWFKSVIESGNGIFTFKSDGIIDFSSQPNRNYISYIRSIPDKHTYEFLATLIMVINESTIQDFFKLNDESVSALFAITDENGNFVISPTVESENDKKIFQLFLDDNILDDSKKNQNKRIVKSKEMQGIMISKKMPYQNWTLSGFFPFTTRTSTKTMFYLALIVFALLNFVNVFICTIVLSKLIFKPLEKMQNHMKLVEEGVFIPMEISQTLDNEITNLQKVNNHMICSVRDLIEQIKKEEKIITKNELDIIYAQINPHFLYNTLDAASALCLTEDTQNCFKLLRALGNFYRFNLSSGRELVTVADELEGIKSYITILNIRYEGRIHVTYDINPNILHQEMLKILLQPLVENSVYHGIKEREGDGNIKITGYKEKGFIYFIIEDDGVGMDEERIQIVLNGVAEDKREHFGIYSLVQRISLYYCLNNPIQIESKVGEGTKITVKIKQIDGYEN